MHEPLPGALWVSAEIPGPAIEELRASVATSIGAAAERPELRAAVATFARQARARGVTPERLLVCLKALWAEEVAAHPSSDRRLHAEQLDRMVSLSINEYYAAPAPG